MIHVRIDNHRSTAVDIYVNISPKSTKTSSSPVLYSNDYYNKEHLYDRLFDTKTSTPRESKIVQNRKDYANPITKKHYTVQQILDNVESIQKQYEQIVHHQTPSTPSCFFTMKQITKVLKNLRTIKSKTTNHQTSVTDYSEHKSPFVFGGETLQWIALPQVDDHIYENALIE